MDIEGKQVAGEPDSSEEEERERQEMRWVEIGAGEGSREF